MNFRLILIVTDSRPTLAIEGEPPTVQNMLELAEWLKQQVMGLRMPTMPTVDMPQSPS